MLPLSAEDPRTIGEFRLHNRLGAGGMGRVYLGSSPGGRAVAVKVIHPHLARDGAFLGRFRREVAAALAVNGGYAAPVVAAGPDDNPPWLATAYVPGPSLQEVVTAGGPLPEDAVLKLAAGLAEALRVIHSCGLVHRDLKPGNVLLAADGPRVIDFGIARALDGTVLTSAESLLGTPSYMSPEQAQSQPAGPPSDVFSLGGVLYFAATGGNPFGTGHPAVMLYRIVHTKPDLDQVPTGLRDLVAACLARDPAGRPAPAELAAALMGVVPLGDPAAFWPPAVAWRIAGHQAGLTDGAPAGSDGGAQAGRPSTLPSVTPATKVQVPGNSWAPPGPGQSGPREDQPGWVAPRPPGDLTGPPGDLTGPSGKRAGETGPLTAPAGPPMGRRRALAALAGMATGGVAVAVWELTRPGKPASRTGTLAGPVSSRPRQRPGTKIWSSTASSPVGSVAVTDRAVFAGTRGSTVYAFDAVTGEPLWHRATPHAFNDEMVVQGGTLVIGDAEDGYLYAYDTATGQPLWDQHTGSALGLGATGGAVYTGGAIKAGHAGGVTALSADRGTLLWTAEFPGHLDTNSGLSVIGGTVYATSAEGSILAYRAADGTRLWQTPLGKDVTFEGGPVLAGDGMVYACSGDHPPAVYAVNAGSGHVIGHHSFGAAQYPAYMALAGGMIFAAVTRDDRLSGPGAGDLIALDAKTGRQRWQVQVAGAVNLGPTVTGGVVYTGSNNGVLDAWQASTGRHLWGFHASDAVLTYVAVTGHTAYFGTVDHKVYAVAAQ
jgi:outer membrane protein assembly factor BamB